MPSVSPPLGGFLSALLPAALLILLAAFVPAGVSGAEISEEEFRELQQTVRDLRRQLESTESKLEEMRQKIARNTQTVEATADAVAESAEAKGTASSLKEGFAIGGYGELHYNNLDAEDERFDRDEIDFHRFVLYFSYDFSERLRFVSELELEHSVAGEGQEGEIELEQAYIEYDFSKRSSGRAGLFLLPIGILNETHEPNTFYGVERNAVENVIIPTTWWVGGIGFTHRMDSGLSFDLSIHEGLKLGISQSTSETRIRSGRQKTSEADASDFAYTASVRYAGIPGLQLGAAIQYQSDPTQNGDDAVDDAWLYEAHVIYNRGGFGLRALYAAWSLDAEDGVEARGYDEQSGWFVEPSYRITEKIGIFARYEDVEGGRSRDQFEQWTTGFNYWPHEQVVLKFDYQERQHEAETDEGRDYDGFNLGVGYQF